MVLIRYLYTSLGFWYSAAFVGLLVMLSVLAFATRGSKGNDFGRWLLVFVALSSLFVGVHAFLTGWIALRYFSPDAPSSNYQRAWAGLYVGLGISLPFLTLAALRILRAKNVNGKAEFQPSIATSEQSTNEKPLGREGISINSQGNGVLEDPASSPKGTIPPHSAKTRAGLAIAALIVPAVAAICLMFVLSSTSPVYRIVFWSAVVVSSILLIADQRRLGKASGMPPRFSWLFELVGLIGFWSLLFPLLFLTRRTYGRPNLFLPAIGVTALNVLGPLAMLAFGPIPPGTILPGNMSESPFVDGHQFEIRLASGVPVEGFVELANNDTGSRWFLSAEPLARNEDVAEIRPSSFDDLGRPSLQIEFRDAAAQRLLRATEGIPSRALAFLVSGEVRYVVPVADAIGKHCVLTFESANECNRVFEELTGRKIVGNEK